MQKKDAEIFDFAAKAISSISYSVTEKSPLTFEQDFDWQGFIKFCNKHKILNIVYYGLKKCNISIPEKAEHFMEENMLYSMLKEAQRSVEIESLSEDFEKNGINHIILKGYIIKDLYPESYLRSMGDIDILVGKQVDEASEIAVNHGFKLQSKDFLHYSFKKGNALSIELHKSLIDESIDKYYNYFGIGFDRSSLCGGFKYKYEFSKEDFYIFLVAHMAKHYEICGTGIRSICDIFIYNRSYPDLNHKYIENELDKIGLVLFENKIRALADYWFGGNFDGKFDSIGEYIISSGVYGNSENHELNAFIINESDETSKFRYFINYIFPNRDYMCARYPLLHKIPILIPLFWIIRIFSTVFKSKGSIRYRLKGVSKYSKEDNRRFEETGLK